MKIEDRKSKIENHRFGFTLLELLTVMAIMFVLMGITLGSYFGMVRASAVDGARDNMLKTLALARQYAMTQRTRAYVVFDEEASGIQTNYSYRVVAQAGIHSGSDNVRNLVVGTPRWEEGMLRGGTVYNLSGGGSRARINGNTMDRLDQEFLEGGTRTRWRRGDRFGWMLFDAEFLPTTLRFAGGVPDTIVFERDGTTERKSRDYEILVEEIVGPAKFRIVVGGLTGRADVE